MREQKIAPAKDRFHGAFAPERAIHFAVHSSVADMEVPMASARKRGVHCGTPGKSLVGERVRKRQAGEIAAGHAGKSVARKTPDWGSAKAIAVPTGTRPPPFDGMQRLLDDKRINALDGNHPNGKAKGDALEPPAFSVALAEVMYRNRVAWVNRAALTGVRSRRQMPS